MPGAVPHEFWMGDVPWGIMTCILLLGDISRE